MTSEMSGNGLVRSFILPPSMRGSMKVPRPTLLILPGRPQAMER